MDRFSSIPRGTRALLIANCAVFILQAIPFIGPLVMGFGELVPNAVFGHGELWRLGTYMFLHSIETVFHLLFNMMALWMFGMELEAEWGTKKFLVFYFVCGIGAALFSYFSFLVPLVRFIPIIGASGAVLGLLTAYAWLYPTRQVMLFFVVPVNVRLIVIGYAILSLVGSMESRSVIAHSVHLGGIVVAFLYLKYGPSIVLAAENVRLTRERHEQKREREEQQAKERYFTLKVDPILRKISVEGMGSVTKEEKKILEDAAKFNKERLTRNKIIPFDAFKKR